jgi:hypothetical protein
VNEQQPVQRMHTARHVGYDLNGRPVYDGWPAAPQPSAPTVPLQPIVARPWGAYVAGGCLGVLALSLVVVLVMFVVFGLTILAAVLALVVVVLTICVLVLRGMWRDHQKGR